MGLDDSDDAGYQRMVQVQNEILGSLAALPPSKEGADREGTTIGQ
jgi:hypothetical protein